MSIVPRRLAAVAAFACLAPLHAAEYPDDAVVVTATRFPEHRLSAPIGMRVITAGDIARSTARTVPELLGTVGGAHVRDNAGSPNAQIDLRGFGITGDDNTLILLDGVRIEKPDLATRPLSAIPLNTIERIEILPGGGAVLYGAGATGGTINIITRNPQADSRRFSVFGGAGSYGAQELGGDLSVAGRELGFMLHARRYQSDNYRSNNDVRQDSILGNLRWQDGPAHVGLRFGGDDQELSLPSYRSEAQLDSDRDGATSPFDKSSIETRFIVLNAGLRAGSVELETDLSYRKGSNDADYVSLASTYNANFDTAIVSPRMRWTLPAMLGISSQLVTGVEWLKTEWDAESAGSFASTADAEQESKSFYAMWFADLDENTRFNYGWRTQRLRNERRDIAPAPAALEDKDNLYANEIALRRNFGPHWSAHIKRARSFRVANADENFGFSMRGALLRPQTGKEKEAGVEFRHGGFKSSLVLFDIYLENEISFNALIPPFGDNTNLSPTERRGGEWQGEWQAAEHLRLAAGAYYTRATFRSGNYGGVDVSGNEVPLVPRWRGNVRVLWEIDDYTDAALQYTYVGKQRYDNDQANTFDAKMPAYRVVGVRLNHRRGDWLFSANIDNLFDEEYYSYAIVSPFSCTSFCAYPQPGRTLFLGAEYRFR